MPKKDPWSYKKRRRPKKVKNSLKETERSILEDNRSSHPFSELSTSTELVSQKALELPLKKEDTIYPDTRFQRSTTLFPAEGTIIDDETEDLTSKNSTATFKRRSEEESISTKPKKLKEMNPPKSLEPTIPEDVVIIESPIIQVKIDLIDLTEISRPVVKLLCSPTKTSHLGNRLPGTPETTFQDNDFHVNGECNETNTISSIVRQEGINCHTIQVKVEKSKSIENNTDISAKMSYINNTKNMNPPTENSIPSPVEAEHRIPKENNAKVNLNWSQTNLPLEKNIQPKAEQSQLSENNTETSFEKSHTINSQHPNIISNDSRLSSELNKEIDDSREVGGQICISSIVSDGHAKDMTIASNVVNHLLNAATIKMEQNNSISVPNFYSCGEPISMNSDDHQIKSLRNNFNEIVEFSGVAAEDRRLNENSDTVNLNQSPAVFSWDNHIQIKAEQSENNIENNYEKSRIVASRHPDITTNDSRLSSEMDKETDDSVEVNGHDCISSNVSDSNAKDSANTSYVFNHLLNAVTIKEKQNDIISDNLTLISNFPSHVEPISMNSDDHPIKFFQNNTNENCKFSDVAAGVRGLNENSDKVNLNQSHVDSPLDNHVQMRAEQSEINFEKSHTVDSRHPNNTTHYSRLSSELKKETGDSREVDGQIYISSFSSIGEPISMNSEENPIDSLQNNITGNCEFSDIIVPRLSSVCHAEVSSDILFRERVSETMDFQENSVNNELQNHGDISQKFVNLNIETNAENSSESHLTNIPDRINNSPNFGNDIFGSGDSQYEPGTFATPLIKYLNCNQKIDMLELLRTKIALNLYRSAANFHSQEKSELYLSEKGEESSNLRISEKPSFNLNVNEIVKNITSLLNFKTNSLIKPNATRLDSTSSPLRKFVDEREDQNPLNIDGLCVGMRQNISPNFLFESSLKDSGSCPRSVTNSETENCPMDIQNSVTDTCPSATYLSPLDDNKRSETSNCLSIASVENPNEKLLPKDFLRQILNNAKTIANNNALSNPSVDSMVQSNIIIDEKVLENLRQIDFLKFKPAESSNIVTDVNEECIAKNSEISPFDLPVPNENINNLFSTNHDTFETPPKRVKKCEDNAAFKKDTRKISFEEYKKRDHVIARTPILRLTSDFQLNSLESSPNSSNFERNIDTPPRNRQNRDIHLCNDTALRNPSHQSLINASSKDPRLIRNNSSLNRDLNSEKHLDSSSDDKISPHQSVVETAKVSIREHQKRAISVSETGASDERFCHSDPNQPTSKRNRIALLPTPSFGRNSLTGPQHHPGNSISGVTSHQPPLSLPSWSNNAPSCSYPPHHFVSEEIHPLMSRHSESTHDQYSSVNVKRQSISYPPLLIKDPPPPVKPSSSNAEPCYSTASERPPDQPHVGFHFVSLVPKEIKGNIGKKIIERHNIYPIIIERNIDWLSKINAIGIERISEIGFEFQQVKFNYVDHITYYNTYLPLLLLECFSSISITMRRKKRDTKICKIVELKNERGYVDILCEGFIHYSEVETIPDEDDIVLVKFGTLPTGGVKMLGYVRSSRTRPYSKIRDNGNDVLKFVQIDNFRDLVKFRIHFCIVFDINRNPGINLKIPIEVSKLTSIKKVIMMNEALAKLPESPLCNIILSPRRHAIKSIVLPTNLERDLLTPVVQETVPLLNTSSPQLILLKSAPFTDSQLAVTMFVEEIQKSEYPGKILVCVRQEILNEMGKNLLTFARNLVIISREKECSRTRLHNAVLDVKISHLSENLNITKQEAKYQVLEESKVLLAVTGTCFYEDVGSILEDLTCCIIHDASSYTEPETLLPLLYKIRHLLLFQDRNRFCLLNSRLARTAGYRESLFNRAQQNALPF